MVAIGALGHKRLQRSRYRRGGGASCRTVVAASSDSSETKRIGVLFVCLGNICRSPTAEAVFRAVVERRGLAHAFDIDSCGTGGGNPDWYKPNGFSYHEGDQADHRMTAVAQKRGVVLTSISRPLKSSDFDRFDLILGMEDKNIRDSNRAARFWDVPDSEVKSRLGLLPSYCQKKTCSAVPDPWYIGTEDSFNNVLDLVEDACEGLLDELCEKHNLV